MATKFGKSFNYDGWYFDWFDDDLPGTQESDWIDGLGGNDNIWGEGGDDDMFGGEGDDWIWATASSVVGAWGEDFADGGNGHDELVFGANTNDVELWGGAGWDGVEGGSGNDILYGDAPPCPTQTEMDPAPPAGPTVMIESMGWAATTSSSAAQAVITSTAATATTICTAGVSTTAVGLRITIPSSVVPAMT